jgi:hypothetical protein
MSVITLHHSKCHVSITTIIHATVDELWEVVFPVGSIPRPYHENQQDKLVSLESSESAVSSWERKPSEVVADGCHMAGGTRGRSPHCCKSLSTKAKLVVREMPASKDRSHGTQKLKNLRHWALSSNNR